MLKRIQNWYQINCNGDWEHRYGYKIETLDNPGWSIKIDLQETALHKLDFNRNFQNPSNENDWFSIKCENSVLEIFCGPENLEQVFAIFFDEIIPNHADPDFVYEIYLPLKGFEVEIWTPAESRLIDEQTVQITKILPFVRQNIKARDIETLDIPQSNLSKAKLNYAEGDFIKIGLETVFDGTTLVPKADCGSASFGTKF